MTAMISSPAGARSADEARADAALLRVLERMASPLRHELAGSLLVPQMQLQLLRRKLARTSPDAAATTATLDEVLRHLQELRALHEATLAWLSLRDVRPLVFGEVVGKAVTSFALPFGAREIGLSADSLACDLVFPAQPMLLLVHAGFWAVLDAIPESAPDEERRIQVACRSSGQSALLEWRLSAAICPPLQQRSPALAVADVAALCQRFGASFTAAEGCWRLQLPPHDAADAVPVRSGQP